MSDTKSAVTVRIAGEEHTIRASAEPEYTRRCARFVDERIQEIRSRAGLMEGHKVAILTALSITDDYFQAQEDLDSARSDAASVARALSGQLEEALGEGSTEDAERVEGDPSN